jgi:hypothetical protein
MIKPNYAWHLASRDKWFYAYKSLFLVSSFAVCIRNVSMKVLCTHMTSLIRKFTIIQVRIQIPSHIYNLKCVFRNPTLAPHPQRASEA